MKTITIYDERNISDSKINNKNLNKDNWVTVYKYKKKTHVENDKIINVLGDCGQYQKDTFYKIQSMSNKDEIFDYYRILKKTNNNKLLIEIESDEENIKEDFMKKINELKEITKEKKEAKEEKDFKKNLIVNFS